MKVFADLLKVGLGFERLFFFILLSLVTVHIVSCLWVMLPSLIEEDDDLEHNIRYEDTWL